MPCISGGRISREGKNQEDLIGSEMDLDADFHTRLAENPQGGGEIFVIGKKTGYAGWHPGLMWLSLNHVYSSRIHHRRIY